MKEKVKDIYWLPSAVLFFIGLLDLLRGVMHTFLLTFSARTFAQFPPTAPADQVFMLGVFGISNLLTGVLYLLISRRARELSPYVLIIIPLTYVVGLQGIWSGGVRGTAAYEGQYFMFAYFAVCIVTFGAFMVQRARRPKTQPVA